MDEGMFFNGWAGIVRTAVVGCAAYAALVVLLRISGKRTLSKMNAFDFIVTVALGSTLATVLLSQDVDLARGLTALGLLIFLQLAITWLSVRSRAVSRLVKSEPRLLFYEGQFSDVAMRDERVNEEEVRQAVRSQGHASLEGVAAVVLETDGSFSVMQQPGQGMEASALSNVRGSSSSSSSA